MRQGVETPTRLYGRVINAIFWLYMWLSDILQPVVTDGNFWGEKLNQAFRLNSHLHDPARMIGNGMVPLALWALIDWRIRRHRRKAKNATNNPRA